MSRNDACILCGASNITNVSGDLATLSRVRTLSLRRLGKKPRKWNSPAPSIDISENLCRYRLSLTHYRLE